MSSVARLTKKEMFSRLRKADARAAVIQGIGAGLCLVTGGFLSFPVVAEWFSELSQPDLVLPEVASMSADSLIGVVESMSSQLAPMARALALMMIILTGVRFMGWQDKSVLMRLCIVGALMIAGIGINSLFRVNERTNYPADSMERVFIDAQLNSRIAARDDRAVESLRVQVDLLQGSEQGKKLLARYPEVGAMLLEARERGIEKEPSKAGLATTLASIILLFGAALVAWGRHTRKKLKLLKSRVVSLRPQQYVLADQAGTIG